MSWYQVYHDFVNLLSEEVYETNLLSHEHL